MDPLGHLDPARLALLVAVLGVIASALTTATALLVLFHTLRPIRATAHATHAMVLETAKTVKETAATTQDTHRIVNSQRTQMLRLLAELRQDLALTQPDDERLARLAKQAKRDADAAAEAETVR